MELSWAIEGMNADAHIALYSLDAISASADRSQALIGVQMASAYVGNCLMPPLFGLIANHISIGLFPIFLLVALAMMVLMHERLVRRAKG